MLRVEITIHFWEFILLLPRNNAVYPDMLNIL